MKPTINLVASLLCGTLFAQQAHGLQIACRLDNAFPGSGTPSAVMAVTLWADAFIEYADLTVWNDVNHHYGNFVGSPSCTTPCFPSNGNPWHSTNAIGIEGYHRAMTLWSAATGTYTMYSETRNWYVEPDDERYTNGPSISCQRAGLVRLIPSGPRP